MRDMTKEENTTIDLNTEAEQSKMKVYGAAVLFSLVVGFSFLAIKTSMKVATPLEILTYRFNFAAMGAVIPLAVGYIKIDLTGKPPKKLILSAGFYLAFMAFQALGLLFATSIESGIIFAIIPILAKIIAHYYLGEKGDWKQNAFICLSITAVIVMFVFSVQDFQGISVSGLILLFLSSFFMALSNVFMRGARREFSPYTIAFAIALGGCLLFNAVTLIMGAVRGEPLHYLAPLAHWEFILSMAFLGVLSTLVSSLLMAYMLAHMPAVKATIFGNLSTAISIVAGVVFLREPLFLYHVVCTALIIAGVVGTSLSGSPRPKRESESEESAKE